MACKTYTFRRKDKNRYRKVYRYLRKKPKYEFVSDGDLTIVVGTAIFDADGNGTATNTATVTYASCDPTAIFVQVPSVTATAVDSYSNDTADVNIFITSVTTSAVTFESSAPFYGEVHFQVIGMD